MLARCIAQTGTDTGLWDAGCSYYLLTAPTFQMSMSLLWSQEKVLQSLFVLKSIVSISLQNGHLLRQFLHPFLLLTAVILVTALLLFLLLLCTTLRLIFARFGVLRTFLLLLLFFFAFCDG